jgi:hypothetical protein
MECTETNTSSVSRKIRGKKKKLDEMNSMKRATNIRYNVSALVIMENSVLWNVMTCTLLETHQRLGGTFYPTAGSPEKLLISIKCKKSHSRRKKIVK